APTVAPRQGGGDRLVEHDLLARAEGLAGAVPGLAVVAARVEHPDVDAVEELLAFRVGPLGLDAEREARARAGVQEIVGEFGELGARRVNLAEAHCVNVGREPLPVRESLLLATQIGAEGVPARGSRRRGLERLLG